MRWNPLSRTLHVYWKGGDPGPQTSTTNTTQLYSPEEAARRAKVMAEAERIYGQTSGTAANLPGPQMSGDTRTAMAMMRQLAQGGWSDIAGTIPGQLQFGYQAAANPTATPGFQDVLGTATRKVNEAYMGPTGPFAGIRSAFQGQNTGGSGTREGIAMGMAGRDYLNAIGDVTGRLTSDAYSQGLDTWARTMAMTPQMMGAMSMPATGISSVGQQLEGYDQAQQQWQLNAPWSSFGPYASTVSGMSAPSGTSTTSTVPGPTANKMAPLGMAMMGASMGAMMGGPMGAMVGGAGGLLLGLLD